jgi:hypothetical protein
MTEKAKHLAREREEIAARVASFKAMQEKFERERHEYYATTLGNAWDSRRGRSSPRENLQSHQKKARSDARAHFT